MGTTRRRPAWPPGRAVVVAFAAFVAVAPAAETPDLSAREKALAILADVYGPGAVEKGIVTIPEKAPEAPHKGRLLADTRNATTLVVGFTGDQGYGYFYTQERWPPENAAAVMGAAKAREMWKILALLDAAETRAADPSRSNWVGFYQGETRLSGTADERPPGHGEVTGLRDVVREMLRAYAVRNICRIEGVELSKSGDDYARALRGLIELAMPPADRADQWTLSRLLGNYARAAPAEADGVIDRITEMRKHPGEWYYKLPKDARLPWKHLEETRRWLPDQWLEMDRDVRRSVEGKSDEEQIRILTDLAFPAGGSLMKAMRGGSGILSNEELVTYLKMLSARRILAGKFHAKWQDLLVEKYAYLDDGDKLNYAPPREMGGDERFCLLIAADPSAPERMKALAQAYLMTGDRELIAKLRGYAGDLSETGGALAADAIEELLKLYNRDKSIGDIPSLAREMLAKPAAYQWRTRGGLMPGGDIQVVCRIVQNLSPEDPKSAAILLDILERPEQVLAPGVNTFEARSQAVWRVAACKWSGAVDALISCLDIKTPSGGRTLDRAVVSALVEIGDARALTALEAALESEKAHPSPPLDDGLSRAPRMGADHLRRAISCLKVVSAADPVEAFGGMGASRCLVEPWAMAKAMKKEEIQALLATDPDEAVQARLIIALYADGDWQHLLYEAKSVGEWR